MRWSRPCSTTGSSQSDESGKPIVLPHEPARMPFFRSLEDKTQPLCVVLAFHAVQTPPCALETNPAGLPKTHPIGSLIGTGCQLLRRVALKMISNPGRSGTGRIGVQRIFLEAIVVPELRVKSMPFLFFGFGEAACLSPSRISTHHPKALHRLSQQSIVETACCFKMRSQMFCLLAARLQGQFNRNVGVFVLVLILITSLWGGKVETFPSRP